MSERKQGIRVSAVINLITWSFGVAFVRCYADPRPVLVQFFTILRDKVQNIIVTKNDPKYNFMIKKFNFVAFNFISFFNGWRSF